MNRQKILNATCPNCGALVECTDEELSRPIQCPSCGSTGQFTRVVTDEEMVAKGALTAAKDVAKASLFTGGLLKRAFSFVADKYRAHKKRSQVARALCEQQETEKQQQYHAAIQQAKANPETPKVWYCYQNGQEHGPMQEAMLQKWIDDGQLGPGDSVRTEEGNIWVRLCDIPERFHVPVHIPVQISGMNMTCQQCGGPMKKTTLSSGNCLGILLALILFFSGLFVAISFSWACCCLGPIIGGLMMLMALGMGGKLRKVWKCTNCGCVLDRA